MKKIAFYGGSFDPVHTGHLTIAQKLVEQFELDEFVFIPAFRAPHKLHKKPTSAFHRYVMLCLATNDELKIRVSKMELEAPEKPYTVETLARLKKDLPDVQIFFVMGSDSWADITTWRKWETVLTMTNHIVITRPGFEISTSHVTNTICDRIVDLRGKANGKDKLEKLGTGNLELETNIYFTDPVNLDISSSEIRRKIRENEAGWQNDLTDEVAKYIEKYQIYK